MRLHDAKQCNAQGKECKDFNIGPVYVGHTKVVKLPYNTSVTFKEQTATGVSPVTIK